MSEKTYKIEAIPGYTDKERTNALGIEWSKFERPVSVYGEKWSGGTTSFKMTEDANGVYITVSTTGARKFWNVHSEIIESDLDALHLLLPELKGGLWNGYKNPILMGASGKINANQAIPNSWE
jgi:hypothetical protein